MLNLLPVRRSRFLPDSINHVFNDPFFRFMEDLPSEGRQWSPAVEVLETDGEFRFQLEVPGLERDDINIEYDNGVLTFSGEKSGEEHTEGERVRSERWYGKFTRSFTLPKSADPEKIAASLKNGVLEVTIQKREEAKPRKVEVKIS